METGHVSVPNPEDAQRIFLTKSPFSLNGGIGYRQKLIPYVKNSPSSTCEDQLDAMRDSNCCKVEGDGDGIHVVHHNGWLLSISGIPDNRLDINHED